MRIRQGRERRCELAHDDITERMQVGIHGVAPLLIFVGAGLGLGGGDLNPLLDLVRVGSSLSFLKYFIEGFVLAPSIVVHFGPAHRFDAPAQRLKGDGQQIERRPHGLGFGPLLRAHCEQHHVLLDLVVVDRVKRPRELQPG